MQDTDRIVAVAFLTEGNLRAVGNNLSRVYTIDDTPIFQDLLQALSEAEESQGGHRWK